MTINWGALFLVAVTTLAVAISIVGLFSLGVVALTAHQRRGGSGSASVVATVSGYACVAVAGLMAVYGVCLMIPNFPWK
jgi:uncharacterized membrane protein